ncbi:MAG: uroporphyrinogen decarboxylase family protein [Clostridia bacterium]|nr:uroporphyrinogen decarboxylase family protein [Clostridia bacterium]
MNMHTWLRAAAGTPGKALPVLSFPAAARLNIPVGQLVRDSGLMADVIAYVAGNTGTAAAVSLMDLSVEAEAFGAAVNFTPNEVPVITGQLVGDEDTAEALAVPAVGSGRTGVCVEGIRLAGKRITDKPLLAGMIGPYSLAGRLMDVTEIMYLCYDEPDTVHTVLRKAAEFLIAYAKAFRAAGADGIVLAEPLAGLLSRDMCAEFSNPYVKEIIDAVQTDDFAVIYHNCGNTVIHMIPDLYALGAAAYHFGNAVDMTQVLEAAPGDMLCMGNIDPAGLLANGTADQVREAVKQLLSACGGKPNFLLSTGCDVPPNAKWENIEAFFEAAR